MARIPVGKFGFQTAEPVAQQRRMPEGAFGAGDGLGAAAASMSHAAHSMMTEEDRQRREQDAEAKAVAKEAQRVASITAQATAKNSLADLHDDLVTGLSDGRYDKDKLAGLQADRSKKVVEDAVAGVAPEHQELVRASLLDDVGRSQRDLRRVVDTRNKQDIAAGIGSYMEQMQRYAQRGETQRQEAMQNVETFLQSAGPQAGMQPQDIVKTVQSFKEGTTLTWLDRAISQNQGNAKALAQIQKDIAEDKFPELDPNKRNFLEAKIQRNQQHLMAKADIAERRNLSNLGIMEKRLSWYVENGRDIPAAELATFEKASKGTVYAGSVQMIVSEQKAVSEMMRLSPAQMGAKIKELEASYGATPSRDQIVHLEKVKRFAANSIKQLHESPLDYAVQREGAVVQPLDLTQPGTWADNLAARTGILKEQSKRNGSAPKGLFPQEAQALASYLSSGSDTAKAETLKMLRKGFGDDAVFRATMQQIAPDSPVTALAGMIATRERPMTISGVFSDQTFTPGSTAGLLLSGERLLNPGKDAKGQDGKPTFPMPKDADLRLKFNSMAGEAFAGNPEAMQITYQATRAAYAALTAQQGNYSGELDDKLLKEAIHRATGGIADVNGGVVIKPWGMDDSTFRNAAKASFSRAVEQAGMPQMKDQWPRLRLQNTKGGYLVKSGTGYLLGKDGNPVLVKVGDLNESSGIVERIPK